MLYIRTQQLKSNITSLWSREATFLSNHRVSTTLDRSWQRRITSMMHICSCPHLQEKCISVLLSPGRAQQGVLDLSFPQHGWIRDSTRSRANSRCPLDKVERGARMLLASRLVLHSGRVHHDSWACSSLKQESGARLCNQQAHPRLCCWICGEQSSASPPKATGHVFNKASPPGFLPLLYQRLGSHRPWTRA